VTEGFDVTIANVTADVLNISVQGPRSFALLSALTGADLASLGYFRLIPEQIELAGVRGWITRTGFSGELGYEFFLDDASGASRGMRSWRRVLDRSGSTPSSCSGSKPAS
jgi:glycine cleavage system aminomethyltransferase T